MMRLLLLMDNRRNRALMAAFLQDHYQIVAAGPEALATAEFDLLIVDGPNLKRHWAVLEARRQAEAPVLLPCLLATTQQKTRLATQSLWRVVDQLLILPMPKAELLARLAILARSRRLARENQALEQQYRSVFNGVPVGLCRVTPDGRLSEANPALIDMLGYPDRATMLQRPVQELFASPEALIEISQRVRQAAPVQRLDVALFRHDHSQVWARVSARAVLDRHGRLLHVEGGIEDITRERQAEQERAQLVDDLRTAIAIRDDFLSIASHELKTPITSLRLQLERVLRQLRTLDESTVQILGPKLKIANTQIDRLVKLIGDLLDVSQITAGHLGLDPEPVDLSQLVDEVLARQQSEIERSGCAVTRVPAGPIVGRWDRSRIDQVITNLIANALKYGAGSPVEIRTTGADGLATVSVRDQGIGIAPEDQARIFKRFERVVSSRHYGGFGLGLWIVRQIVEDHGGRISVSSLPGQGSTFSVELPLAGPLSS